MENQVEEEERDMLKFRDEQERIDEMKDKDVVKVGLTYHKTYTRNTNHDVKGFFRNPNSRYVLTTPCLILLSAT